MPNVVPAPAGANILVLDRSDRTVVRIPVVAFDVLNTIAYPVCAIAFRGLLKAERALELNGFIMDRGFEIPFDSEESWVQWAMSVEPGTETEAAGTSDEEVIHASVNETTIPEQETAQEMAARLRKQNAPTMEATGPKVTPKARKTFASKSFWQRTNTQGVLEIVEIDAGLGLPRDTEGFEKIKRDDYAALKKQAKAGEAAVVIIAWDDGPVLPGSHEEETLEQEAGDEDEDFGGLV